MTSESPNQHRVVVVSYPAPRGNGERLSAELDVVKGSILYADDVTLISPQAEMWAAFSSPEATGTMQTLIETLSRFDATFFEDVDLTPAIETARSFETDDRFSPEDRQKIRIELAQDLRQYRPEVVARIEQMVARSNFSLLLPALDAGILKIEGGYTATGRISADLFSSWLDAVRRVLADPYLRLVLDDRTSAFVTEHLAAEHAADIAKRYADAEVGARLIARLPTFPTAPLDELLDLRADLEDALGRYRGAAARFASDMATRDIGPDLRREVEHHWTAVVASAIADIHEQMNDHGLVREIARAASESVQTLVLEGAGMFVALNSVTSLNGWVSGVASAAAPAVQATVTGARRAREARQAAERHELYYLYALSQAGRAM